MNFEYFNGSYYLLKLILKRFNIYDSRASILSEYYGYGKYSITRNYLVCGVPQRMWHLLYLDLQILNIIKPETQFISLNQLEKEINAK